jgi:hypothetical protein
VARSGYSDYPSVQSSQLSDRVLAAQGTDADNGEESSVAVWDNVAGVQVVVGQRLRFQSLQRETQ